MAQRAMRRYLSSPTVLGYTRKGVPVISIAGGSGEPPPVDDDDDDSDDDDDDSEDKSKGKGDDDDAEAVRRRMQAADRRASSMEAELKELRDFKKEAERANQDEVERLTSDVQEASERAETAEARALRAEQRLNIVLANGKLKRPFRDPDDVLRYIDVEDVVDDDGNVDKKSLNEALEELAKTKSYLLSDVSGDDDDDDEDEDEDDKSGRNSGRLKGKKGKGGVDKEALKKKYPALRR